LIFGAVGDVVGAAPPAAGAALVVTGTLELL
jgi:hypothetical protein